MIEIKNTRDLVQPDKMRLKVLVIGRSRVGKTTWAGTAPNPGIAACETGHGGGTLSLHKQGLDYFEPKSLEDLDALASGHIFKDKETLVLDSLSAMARTIIKDFAIRIPRRGASSPKREQGVPELDDYGVMAEITRRILDALLDLPKHVIVTALEKTEKDENGSAIACGPDLPGQMFLASPAMFDTVLYLKTRKAFKNPADPKTAYTQHYFLTQNDGFHIGGDRNNISGHAILAKEEPFDVVSGAGSFADIYKRITAAYAAAKGV
jgi:hypothetical protein